MRQGLGSVRFGLRWFRLGRAGFVGGLCASDRVDLSVRECSGPGRSKYVVRTFLDWLGRALIENMEGCVRECLSGFSWGFGRFWLG